MIRYCRECGLKSSEAGRSVCKACGGTLVEPSDLEELGRDEPAKFANACCPNPRCESLVARTEKNFCGDCGSRLEPPSYELWVGKFVEPALAADPAAVLLGQHGLSRYASRMGLAQGEAREHLSRLLEEHAGVGRDVLAGWIRETKAGLARRRSRLEAAGRDAVRRAARLGIKPRDAEGVVARLSRDLAASPGGPPPARAAGGAGAAGRMTTAYRLRKLAAAEETYYLELLEAGAQSLYKSLAGAAAAPGAGDAQGGEGEPGGMIRSGEIYLVEAGGRESAFVLFTDAGGRSWVLSNPQLDDADVSTCTFLPAAAAR
jgi:hypothetical protein